MATSRIALVLATALLLAGCASMRDDGSTAYVQPTSQSQATIVDDVAFMQKVERQARMRGIEVTWVNPPVKRTKDARTPR
jgi:PBP1b-binding outer membrane lipoprotein LpoB